ncbi:sugar ABC transporter ATP-binding protein [Methylorubrum populi]|uniref:sugar ABC transporter ATP-binding protein n=1 Tax=Methylorubrum TaxID=2282523 RepID=UPI00114E29B3|nr:sugar ABC transporter ATP-binding protein [Methylorubrum populi]QDI79914.1 sugar ABC transporter ATP-binding protein [Methylorubrum populi]
MASDIVKIVGLRKSYGQNDVLKGVDLTFRAGEVHAFVGANGAGKSTLLGCLSGATPPSSGKIIVDELPYDRMTPRSAIEKGIGIIYQHFQVIDDLSVVDNIFLGSEKTRFGLIEGKDQYHAARRLLERLGSTLDPNSQLADLSIGERQVVEIARALHLRPRVLILDEPTAALSDREMKALHKVVRHLVRNENLAVVYVTHLLDEIQEVADVVTILRDGLVVWTRPVQMAPVDEIAKAIAPRLDRSRKPRESSRHEAVVAELLDYSTDFVKEVSFDIRRGEVVGLYGLLGSGRTDLLESLVGARPRAGGEFRLNGSRVRFKGPGPALGCGVALVASDRNEQSLFGELSALENLLMPHFGGIARDQKIRRPLFEKAALSLGLTPKSPGLEAKRFSGGNAQKLVIGRWLLPQCKTKLLLLDEPTQGVDIGAREDLYRLLFEFTAGGGAILVASSDPAEIAAISNRVIILAHGQPVAVLEDDIQENRLVELAHLSKSIFESPRSAAIRAAE